MPSARAGKRTKGAVCAGGFPTDGEALPVIEAHLNGRRIRALIDSGSTSSIVNAKFAEDVYSSDSQIMNVNGQSITCDGGSTMKLNIAGVDMVHSFLVMRDFVRGVDVIIGLDVIRRLGGVIIKDGSVEFCRQVSHESVNPTLAACEEKIEPLVIDDPDFTATFQGSKWVVAWRWKDGPPTITNRITNYGIPAHLSQALTEELQSWVKEGWVQPTPSNQDRGLVPLIPIKQPMKKNARPVLDFREINQYIVSHTAQADVCDKTIRRWR